MHSMRAIGAALALLCLPACLVGDEGETASEQVPYNFTPPAEPCVPGAMYVCDCGGGNLGNKFCEWSGEAFSECMLCGEGAEYIANTGIACDTNPPPGQDPVECPTSTSACTSLVCFNHECWEATAMPRTIVPDTAANDCRAKMCDGFGNIVEVPDPDDCAGTCGASGSCI